jgi:hypothetical protein
MTSEILRNYEINEGLRHKVYQVSYEFKTNWKFNLRSDACEQFKSIGLNYNDVVSGFSHLNYRQIYQLLEKI